MLGHITHMEGGIVIAILVVGIIIGIAASGVYSLTKKKVEEND